MSHCHDTSEHLFPSLPLAKDPATGFPLLETEATVINLTLNFLALPHSVVEYGCGKKASLILWMLTLHGLPPYALKRGLVTEWDLSEEALRESNPQNRRDSLTVRNPLHQQVDLSQASQRHMLVDAGFEVNEEENSLEADSFQLSLDQQIQFRQARSHVFAIVTFWDPRGKRTVDRVIDPTLCRERCFAVPQIRDFLTGCGSLIFTAPVFARLRLDPRHLTDSQRTEIARHLGTSDPEQGLAELDHQDHAALVRKLTRSAAGSLGDPESWSYANNFRPSPDHAHDEVQSSETGLGEALRADMARLQQARQAGETVDDLREKLEEVVAERELKDKMRRDAHWSGLRLEPLARLAAVVAAHLSLRDLAQTIRDRTAWPGDPAKPEHRDRMRGVGIRLRQRIEELALASANEEGEISACALTLEFNRAAAETIRQMNKAGLTVWIDQVGNIHGLSLGEEEEQKLKRGQLDLRALTRHALCHGSHIDTVRNAGKLDGRLGVMAGIEIASVIDDLRHYFEVTFESPPESGRLMVSAFMGEEMTFSGKGVGMPGSAAVTGRATVETVHGMTNEAGETLRACLLQMLRFLVVRRRAGEIDFHPAADPEDDEALLQACPPPSFFATRHTYERHLEKGRGLVRAGLPLVLADRIMGLHHEDFILRGRRAEEAALDLTLRLRQLALSFPGNEVRTTVGIIQPDDPHSVPRSGWRWTLTGEKNHAGSILIGDRSDPGVAAARLARKFRELAGPEGLITEIHLMPGHSRNVIPEQATLTLGKPGEPASERNDSLRENLITFVRDTLSRPVEEGGENLQRFEVEEVTATTRGHRCRLSLDLRTTHQAQMADALAKLDEIIAEIATAFDLRTERAPQGDIEAVALAPSGQVLQLERSCGNSHHHAEVQLAEDLLCGTMVQLAATRTFRQHPNPDSLNLHQLTSNHLPPSWRERVDQFVSGALHDTSNVAASHQDQEATSQDHSDQP